MNLFNEKGMRIQKYIYLIIKIDGINDGSSYYVRLICHYFHIIFPSTFPYQFCNWIIALHAEWIKTEVVPDSQIFRSNLGVWTGI